MPLDIKRMTVAKATDFSYTFPYVFGYKGVNIPIQYKDIFIVCPHVFVDITCTYTVVNSTSPYLELHLSDIRSVGTDTWDHILIEDHGGKWDVDLPVNDWKELLVNIIGTQFPGALISVIDVRPIKLKTISVLRGWHTTYPNLITMINEWRDSNAL